MGTAVGDTLGCSVGDLVGSSVGVDVGDTLGCSVGVDVGDTLGCSVGAVVGATVNSQVWFRCGEEQPAMHLYSGEHSHAHPFGSPLGITQIPPGPVSHP